MVSRLFRLVNVIGKRKVGVLLGAVVGISACFLMPLTVSFFYAKAMHWVSAALDGRLALPLTLLALVLLMVLASGALLGLRIAVAHIFRGRRYGPRRVVLH